MTDINFTEIDAATLKDKLINQVETFANEQLMPGDERRIFAEGVAYALSVFISSTNEACKARLLKYASGYALDALGERVGCARLSPSPAKTTLQFSLSAPRSISTTIPAGTRVTADNTILFATDAPCTIPAGDNSITVHATATVGGKQTNGIPTGAVQSFVDDVPFVNGVTNLAESSGGDDGEPFPVALDPENGDEGTGDDNYRKRIALAPSSFSVAGPASAYEYYAKSASANVSDVKVVSNQEAGTVQLIIVETGGKIPTNETLATVLAAVTKDDIKPLGDKVLVAAPEIVEYSIDINYYCLQADETATIKAIEGDGGALEQYRTWQDSVIGRDINPDRLRAYCLDHCPRLEVTSPLFETVSDTQIARWDGQINVTRTIINE